MEGRNWKKDNRPGRKALGKSIRRLEEKPPRPAALRAHFIEKQHRLLSCPASEQLVAATRYNTTASGAEHKAKISLCQEGGVAGREAAPSTGEITARPILQSVNLVKTM